MFHLSNCPMNQWFLNLSLLDLKISWCLVDVCTILMLFLVKPEFLRDLLRLCCWKIQKDQRLSVLIYRMPISHPLEICTRICQSEHCYQLKNKYVLSYLSSYPCVHGFAIYTKIQLTQQSEVFDFENQDNKWNKIFHKNITHCDGYHRSNNTQGCSTLTSI